MRYFREQGLSVHIYGIELSQDCILRDRDRVETFGVSTDITLIQDNFLTYCPTFSCDIIYTSAAVNPTFNIKILHTAVACQARWIFISSAATTTYKDLGLEITCTRFTNAKLVGSGLARNISMIFTHDIANSHKLSDVGRLMYMSEVTRRINGTRLHFKWRNRRAQGLVLTLGDVIENLDSYFQTYQWEDFHLSCDTPFSTDLDAGVIPKKLMTQITSFLCIRSTTSIASPTKYLPSQPRMKTKMMKKEKMEEGKRKKEKKRIQTLVKLVKLKKKMVMAMKSKKKMVMMTMKMVSLKNEESRKEGEKEG